MHILRGLAGLVLVSAVVVGNGAARADDLRNAFGTHHLKNAASGRCLDPNTESVLPHELVKQQPCRNAKSQEWIFDDWSPYNDYWKVRNNNSGLCLAPVDPAGGNATILEQIDCGTGPEVLWSMVSTPRGWVFHSVPTGRCLDIPDGVQRDDVLAQIWDCNSNTNNQGWSGL